MSDIDPIIELFRQEANENLAALEKGFLDLEQESGTQARGSIIARLFRHAHGMKGAARAVELLGIQNRAQALEETLDDLRENPETITPDAIQQGLTQFDALRQEVDKWQNPSAPAAVSPSTASPVEKHEARIESPDEAYTVRVNSDRLDRMLSLAGELRISQRAAELHSQQLQELLLTDVRRPAGEEGVGNGHTAIENLIDRLERIQAEIHKRQAGEAMLLESLESDIREARLLPLSTLADSFRRAVRDLSQSLGKSIRYEVDVGTVLLDKAVIEALNEPLLHMIRNAAHHGIEVPQKRRNAGKPDEGRILLRAMRHGDRVRIRVSDDGRGVDFDEVRARVKQFSGLDDAEVDEFSDHELAAYLFQAGFTTAAQVDEISGRGVGLDAVQEAVRLFQGNVELESSSAAGTSFIMDVPVTISTVRILTVACGGQYYGIPSSSIVRTARVQPDKLLELEGNSILTVDDEPVPWVMLSDFVSSTTKTPDGSAAVPYVLTSHEGQRLAIGVDDTEDELEVILKPLGFPLTGMAGVVGGTVRPDGSVQIVLDVATMRPRRITRIADHEPRKEASRILVVDDSPTTRTILRNVLSAAGYVVRTASDGLDALEQLRSQPFDLVVSDVQMPRMNGLELTRQIKSKFGLPVLLVTGMEKEADRREGLNAGADAYIVKSSFAGEGLLEIVKQFV